MTATRLAVYQPNGATLGTLPTPSDVSVGYPLNDLGALTFQYAPGAPRDALLGQPLELAVEVSYDEGATWEEPPSSRFLYLRDGRDPIRTGDAWAVEAAAYLIRLTKALVGFDGLNADGAREFTNATPGAILATLWDEAQARGALEGMTRTWTAATDSAGTPWPATRTVTYEAGKDLLAVLREFAEDALVDFRTQGRAVEVYVADSPAGMGADRTTGGAPVVLRHGRDLTEAPFRRTWEGLADTAFLKGDGGATLVRSNPAASKPWGRQETYVTASGVSDAGTLTAIGDAALTLTAQERAEHTYGLDFRAAPSKPLRDYGPGEWVLASVDGLQEPQRYRVMQVTLTRDADGNASGNVVLNDRFVEADVATARRIQRLTQGATQGGTGTTPAPVGPDILAPAAPTSLNATSTAYVRDDGRIQAQVSLDWPDVTTNADATPATDVAKYEVWRRTATIGIWAQVGTATGSAWFGSPYDPGQVWDFRVRAVDQAGNEGAWSPIATVTAASDTDGPAKPSTPTAQSRLGVARIAWDGLADGGGTMPPDYSYTAVHVALTNNFTPTDENRVGELSAAGYVVAGPLTYDTTYYARLVAYDTSGNPSPASNPVAITVAPLVDVSNFPDDAMEDLYARTGHFLTLTADNFTANLIEGAWIKAGAVDASKVTVGANIGTTLIRNGTMEDVADGKPVLWLASIRNGAGGTLTSNAATPLAGTRSARVTMAAAADGAYLSSDPVPINEGAVVVVEVTIRVNAAISGIPTLSLGTSPEDGDPRNPFAASTTWQSAFNLTPPTSGQRFTLKRTWTIPAGHRLMSLIVSLPPNTGGGYTADVDTALVTYAVPDDNITSVSAGKITTGIVQAGQRIVAGSLTGARAEMNASGFLAARSDGMTTFQVTAADGVARVGGTTGARVEMSVKTNVYEANTNWALVDVYTQNNDWGPGRVWGSWTPGSGGSSSEGSLRLSSPYATDWTKAAVMDLLSRNNGTSSLRLSASDVSMTAKDFIFGDSASAPITFNILGNNSFHLQQSVGNNRLAINMDTALSVYLRAIGKNGSRDRLLLEGSAIYFLPSGGDATNGLWGVDGNGLPWIGRNNLNSGISFSTFNGGQTQSRNGGGALIPHVASSHPTSSDRALKRDEKPLEGGLKVVKALQSKTYRWKADGRRGTGFIAQEVASLIPEAVAGEEGELAVDAYPLVAYLWAAVQELAAKTDTLSASLNVTRRSVP